MRLNGIITIAVALIMCLIIIGAGVYAWITFEGAVGLFCGLAFITTGVLVALIFLYSAFGSRQKLTD